MTSHFVCHQSCQWTVVGALGHHGLPARSPVVLESTVDSGCAILHPQRMGGFTARDKRQRCHTAPCIVQVTRVITPDFFSKVQDKQINNSQWFVGLQVHVIAFLSTCVFNRITVNCSPIGNCFSTDVGFNRITVVCSPVDNCFSTGVGLIQNLSDLQAYR